MKPILFSTPMVKALLAGSKTMTRRVVNPQPKVIHELRPDGVLVTEQIFRSGKPGIKCPYWVGDILWVRETWALGTWADEPRACPPGLKFCIHYIADDRDGKAYYSNDKDYDRISKLYKGYVNEWKPRPSIHMPRWAARLFLEVTSVKVERLQDISDEDARREGDPHQGLIASENTHKEWFKALWDSLNAKRGYSWESNPWVFAYEFKRTEVKE